MDTFNYVKPVMPSVYCREDAAWVQEMLGKLPRVQQEKIAYAYADAYRAAHDAEPVSYRQENAGRYAANTRLRLYVERYSRASQGFASPPPLAQNARIAA
ncbi:hypothetical protein C5E24_06680 [Pectobacterium parmentieri]|uniref:hypothetical protein n=1 Tax=Pectobacterium parmentieri TaxID=1905730 RepID=UPI000EAC7845|nr:hypothetical protein [Pectobacterium parmentieri]AYH09396.1 hypothetical protein C5E24_06680 [Pectobacterium parmentieri]